MTSEVRFDFVCPTISEGESTGDMYHRTVYLSDMELISLNEAIHSERRWFTIYHQPSKSQIRINLTLVAQIVTKGIKAI